MSFEVGLVEMNMRKFLYAVVALLVGVIGTGHAQERSADLELVLLADATGSIDAAEIQFQRQGYATALQDPEILSAIAQGYDGQIAVTYVEWADQSSQDVVVPWTLIDGPESAKLFADALLVAPRQAFGRNAIGSALDKGIELIETNDIRAPRRVIDLSADSANNWNGPPIELIRAKAFALDITINGLAVLCRHCSGRPVAYDLEQRFSDEIITGPASFVVTADGDVSFADAVRKKLLLEIAGIDEDIMAWNELWQAKALTR